MSSSCSSQQTSLLQMVMSYLLAFGDSRLEEAQSGPVSNRAGYRDDKWFFILRDAWNAIHTGHPVTDQAKHLIAGGWMVHGDGKNFLSKTPGWVSGRPRADKVRIEILGAAFEASGSSHAA